ncbi:MAG: pyridoxamine 5'-phosphate oxidase family protein [Eubacterium sp.]
MFDNQILKFYNEFGTHRNMVLSTSYQNKVSSRMMSIVRIGEKFYFQTDKNFRKYEEIKENPNVSLCIDNIQIEGVCREIGASADNIEFCTIFKTAFSKAFELYSMSENEVLFEITPTYIERWIYENDRPYILSFDLNNNQYLKERYNVNK